MRAVSGPPASSPQFSPQLAMSTVLDQRSHDSFPGADREQFRARGYAVVKRVFEREEIEQLRKDAERAMSELERSGLAVDDPGPEGVARYARCDVLSIPEVRHVLLDRRLVSVIAELLGDSPTYFGESVLRIGSHGGRAWHRDNVDRSKRLG